MRRYAVRRTARRAIDAALVLALTVLLLVGGCRGRDSTGAPPAGPDTYGQLALVRQTGDRKLQDEVARLEEERATPLRLVAAAIPADENAAVILAALWPASKVKAVFEESDGYFPAEEFQFSPATLEKASIFRQRYPSQQEQVQTALARPQCRFAVAMDQGWKADLSFAWMVRVAARLEAFAAAEALARGDAAAAATAVDTMFRLAACLAGEKHPAVRFHGMSLRTEACMALGALVRHPAVARPQIEALYRRVQDALDRWPPDADAWVADRALGLYAYEMVRDGKVSDLLTAAESESLRRDGKLRDLPAAVLRNVNADELYYLQTMRTLVDLCRQPYYQRVAWLDRIDAESKASPDRPEYPLIAARLLLPGVQRGQASQAQERAYLEAWAVALALAAGLDPPQYRVSPVSGNPYQIVRRDGAIAVDPQKARPEEGWPSVVVPDPAAPRQPPAAKPAAEERRSPK